jgi:sugar/nucleoside kinase (ribokinase family)
MELTGYSREPGGEVATTLVGLARLECTTAYAGRFGMDDEGDLGLRSLIDEGVDVTYAERVDGALTQIAFIIIDERTGERTVLWHRDKKLAYDPSEAPLEAPERGKILHLTPHDAPACVPLAKLAKEKGVIVSLDIDNVFDGIDDLLPLVDVLIGSAEFSAKLTGSTDARSALCQLRSRYGSGVIGVTLGSSGSLFLCEDVFIETNGFEAPGGCKDTTGAGDAFRTGLLYGILQGESIEEAARTANAVAALKCRKFGARSGLPDKQELNKFLE